MEQEPNNDPSRSLRELIQQQGHFMTYEEYHEGLPMEFTTAEGLRVVRVGIMPWFQEVNHPNGEDWKVSLGGLFVFDPNRGKVIIETSPQDPTALSQSLEADGWKVIFSSTNRVVAFRTKTP